jgi:hypothetical protein
MSATKKEIMADLKYCKESLDRIIRYADKSYEDDSYFTHHTVIQADIIKLRRELNEINHKFTWDYGRK